LKKTNKKSTRAKKKTDRLTETLEDIEKCLIEIQKDAGLLEDNIAEVQRIRAYAFTGIDLTNKAIRYKKIVKECKGVKK